MANMQILEEAAAWFAESEGDELTHEQRREFDQWLRRSPEHVRAFLDLLPIWEAGQFATGASPQELIALVQAVERNVVPLPSTNSARSAPLDSSSKTGPEVNAATARRRTRWQYTALAASLLIGVTAVIVWFRTQGETFVTQIGEQRSITLADSSLLLLNADSEVRIRMNADERSIDLVRGQAMFHVAKDPTRPFIVRS